MTRALAIIGFGEAGRTFAAAGDWRSNAHVFDIKVQEPATGPAKRAEMAATGVIGADTAAAALAGRDLVLCLVTADRALSVAREDAPLLVPGALWCDMNSVAPETKRAAAREVEAAGGRYVDVAVMAPVEPSRLAVPLLASGPHAEAAVAAMSEAGFTNVRAVGDAVGRASAIKMIRSVMVKGTEALTAEMMLAAVRAGVVDEVLGSLGPDWHRRADYNLDRMMVHGVRRAAEMEEAVRTLEDLGVEAAMTRATVDRQRRIGAARLAPPEGLAAKLESLNDLGADPA